MVNNQLYLHPGPLDNITIHNSIFGNIDVINEHLMRTEALQRPTCIVPYVRSKSVVLLLFPSQLLKVLFHWL